jgi:hypothetical protein
VYRRQDRRPFIFCRTPAGPKRPADRLNFQPEVGQARAAKSPAHDLAGKGGRSARPCRPQRVGRLRPVMHFLRCARAKLISCLPDLAILSREAKKRPETGTLLATVLPEPPGTVGRARHRFCRRGRWPPPDKRRSLRWPVAASGYAQDNAKGPDRRVHSRPAVHELARRR